MKVNRQHFFRFIVIAMIAAFTINLFILNINRYYSGPVIFFTAVSLIVAFLSRRFFNIHEISLYLLYAMMLVTSFVHSNSFRAATILYSGMFVLSFISYRRLLRTNCLSVVTFLNVIKRIIYLYAAVLIIQQVSVLIGFPVFNRSMIFKNAYKLNSLAWEPSYVGSTITLLAYSYFTLQKKISKLSLKKLLYLDRRMWIAYFYVIFTCGSAHTLFIGSVFFLYLAGKRFSFWFVAFFTFIVISVFIFTKADSLLEIEAVRRLVRIIPATLMLDTSTIIDTDLSAAARIAPPLFYLNWFNPLDINYWIGHGIDFSKNTIIVYLLDSDQFMEQGNATGGLFPAYFLDYGLISGIMFFICLKKFALGKIFSFPTLLWIICFLSQSFNTVMQWMFWIIMTTTLFFENEVLRNSQEGK